MQHGKRWMIVVLIIASLQLSACTKKSDTSSKVAPAKLESIEGTNLKRVTVTAKAAERLGIKTAPVRDAQVAPQRLAKGGNMIVPTASTGTVQAKVVPYAAVLYDAKGATWVYTTPKPLTFVRQQIQINYIEGDLAVLSDGPAAGTEVVTVGGAELFGTETGIGK
jgi:hypothetical protein